VRQGLAHPPPQQTSEQPLDGAQCPLQNGFKPRIRPQRLQPGIMDQRGIAQEAVAHSSREDCERPVVFGQIGQVPCPLKQIARLSLCGMFRLEWGYQLGTVFYRMFCRYSVHRRDVSGGGPACYIGPHTLHISQNYPISRMFLEPALAVS
jgi:hypothetical protein